MEKINRTKGNLTLEEEVATLIKPAKSALRQVMIYVEGPTDVKIYRAIALQVANAAQVAFAEKGGRNSLFKLHEALVKSEIPILRPVLFFADRDLFVFQPIPDEHNGIFFTNGYSIENDLFQDGESILRVKLRPQERTQLESLIVSISDWFAHEVNLLLTGKASDAKITISLQNNMFVDLSAGILTSSFLSTRNYSTPPEDLHRSIFENYSRLLRGKFLFDVLVMLFKSRETEDLKLSHESHLWLDCIAEGIRDTEKPTNCNRIVLTIKESLQNL